MFDRTFGDVRGLDDGSYVGTYVEFFRDEDQPRRERHVAHVSAAGEQLARITGLPQLSEESGKGPWSGSG
jgi:hypothetical protein